MIGKPPEAPARKALDPPASYVVVPYIPARLRDETTDAVMNWGGPYAFHSLPAGDPYAYGRALMDWWETHLDLVVVEHDVVPAPGMIAGLLDCAQPWCGHAYHIGQGRFATGLGLCKISRSVMDAYPVLATLAMRDAQGRVGRMDWRGVNEALDRQMTRYGYTFHLHEPVVEHLHYPRAGGGDG